MNKILIKYLVFGISLICSLADAQTAVQLTLGETKSLPLKGSNQIWIQEKGLLQASAVGNALKIRGLQEGETLLKISSSLYRIQIVHPSKAQGEAPLKAVLKTIVGLRLEVEQGSYLVTGRLHTLEDLLKIQKRAVKEKFHYQLQVDLTPSLQRKLEGYFQNLLEKAKLPPQNLSFIPKLEMRLKVDALLMQKYRDLLQPYGITLVTDAKSVSMEPTVKVEITVAEVRNGFVRDLGILTPEHYTGKILDSGVWESSGAEFSIKAREEKGDLRILASPNILCRSGKEAEFLAGGEFPIKIFNYHTSDIVWKRYGILLKVKPVADSTGRISLSIETEVSTIDSSRTVDGIPGILTNKVSSHFDLAKSQTIALSGLLKNENNNDARGLPGLMDIPILGSLFSSRNFKDNKTELVIFVRPSVLQESEMGRTKARHL